MNGRIHSDASPEERIAAVCKTLADKFQDTYTVTGVGPERPDYADLRDCLRPFIQRELLWARIDEARKTQARVITERVKELGKELALVEAMIPKELQ